MVDGEEEEEEEEGEENIREAEWARSILANLEMGVRLTLFTLLLAPVVYPFSI